MVSDGWHCSGGGSLPDLSLPPAPLLVVSQEDQQGWDQAPEAQGNNEQSWARDKFLGSRQRDKKIVEKIMVSVVVTMNSKNAKSNNFEAWNYGHVVAAVLSSAQRW